jgi:hypothetical protein
MEDVHSLVIASYLLGKSCMTSFWIGFAFLSSISQLLLSLRDGYAQGAEDNGDTISSPAVAVVRYYEPSLMAYATFVFNKLKF